jgi:hypothetical protein
MTCRECRAVAALADAQRVINRPKAKKERIAFAPMNLSLGERSWLVPAGTAPSGRWGRMQTARHGYVRSVGHGPKVSQGMGGFTAGHIGGVMGGVIGNAPIRQHWKFVSPSATF